jgi:hypothetical protein
MVLCVLKALQVGLIVGAYWRWCLRIVSTAPDSKSRLEQRIKASLPAHARAHARARARACAVQRMSACVPPWLGCSAQAQAEQGHTRRVAMPPRAPPHYDQGLPAALHPLHASTRARIACAPVRCQPRAWACSHTVRPVHARVHQGVAAARQCRRNFQRNIIQATVAAGHRDGDARATHCQVSVGGRRPRSICPRSLAPSVPPSVRASLPPALPPAA